MEKYNAITFSDTEIVLSDVDKLQSIFDTIENGENFIIEWYEAGTRKSKIVIGSNITGKVKGGDIDLRAETKGNEST